MFRFKSSVRVGWATRYNDPLTCLQKLNFSCRIRCYSIVFNLFSSFLNVEHLQSCFQDEFVLLTVAWSGSGTQIQKLEQSSWAAREKMNAFWHQSIFLSISYDVQVVRKKYGIIETLFFFSHDRSTKSDLWFFHRPHKEKNEKHSVRHQKPTFEWSPQFFRTTSDRYRTRECEENAPQRLIFSLAAQLDWRPVLVTLQEHHIDGSFVRVAHPRLRVYWREFFEWLFAGLNKHEIHGQLNSSSKIAYSWSGKGNPILFFFKSLPHGPW